MTDFTITSGTASYKRTRRPADFEAQEPFLLLNFEVAPDSDPEKVTSRVMLMARNAVEGVFGAPASSSVSDNASTSSGSPALSSQTPPRRGRKAGDAPVATPPQTVDASAKEPTGADDLAALAGETKTVEPTPSPEDDLAALSGEPAKTFTSDDVKHALMAASSHLRKEFGHIHDIEKLLASFSVGGWASLKVDQYPDFIAKAKMLLDLKKD